MIPALHLASVPAGRWDDTIAALQQQIGQEALPVSALHEGDIVRLLRISSEIDDLGDSADLPVMVNSVAPGHILAEDARGMVYVFEDLPDPQTALSEVEARTIALLPYEDGAG